MNKSKREKIVNEIVNDFTERQIHDSYYFEHSQTQIEWSAHQEVYLILYLNKTFDYAEPKHLESYVEDLKDQDLKEYLINQ